MDSFTFVNLCAFKQIQELSCICLLIVTQGSSVFGSDIFLLLTSYNSHNLLVLLVKILGLGDGSVH